MSDFKLDISKFTVASKAEARNSFQGLAHIAELAERHDDMCAFMREVVKAVQVRPSSHAPLHTKIATVTSTLLI